MKVELQYFISPPLSCAFLLLSRDFQISLHGAQDWDLANSNLQPQPLWTLSYELHPRALVIPQLWCSFCSSIFLGLIVPPSWKAFSLSQPWEIFISSANTQFFCDTIFPLANWPFGWFFCYTPSDFVSLVPLMKTVSCGQELLSLILFHIWVTTQNCVFPRVIPWLSVELHLVQ